MGTLPCAQFMQMPLLQLVSYTGYAILASWVWGGLEALVLKVFGLKHATWLNTG